MERFRDIPLTDAELRLVRRQRLPGILGGIGDLCGYRVSEDFAVHFGGCELYIPATCGPEHAIARAVGVENAQVIGAAFGGPHIGPKTAGAWDVPIGDAEIKWNVARALRVKGLSRNQIVLALRLHWRLPISIGRVSALTADMGLVSRPTGSGAGRPRWRLLPALEPSTPDARTPDA